MNVNNLVKTTLYLPYFCCQLRRVVVPQTICHARFFWINILACENIYMQVTPPIRGIDIAT